MLFAPTLNGDCFISCLVNHAIHNWNYPKLWVILWKRIWLARKHQLTPEPSGSRLIMNQPSPNTLGWGQGNILIAGPKEKGIFTRGGGHVNLTVFRLLPAKSPCLLWAAVTCYSLDILYCTIQLATVWVFSCKANALCLINTRRVFLAHLQSSRTDGQCVLVLQFLASLILNILTGRIGFWQAA